eukprot:c20087_g2_i1 orf=278-2761(+)
MDSLSIAVPTVSPPTKLYSVEPAVIHGNSSSLEANGCDNHINNSQKDFAEIEGKFAPLQANGMGSDIDRLHLESSKHGVMDESAPCADETSSSLKANVCILDDCMDSSHKEFAESDENLLAPLEANGCMSNNINSLHSENGENAVTDHASAPYTDDNGLRQDGASHGSNVPCDDDGVGRNQASNGANVPSFNEGSGEHGASEATSPVDSGLDRQGISHEASAPSITDGSGCSSHEVNGSGWIRADGAPSIAPTSAPEKPWPFSKRHTFYLVRIPRYVNEKLRNDISSAEAKLSQAVEKRDALKATLQDKKTIKAEILERLKPIKDKERACRDALQGKRLQIEQVSQALKKTKNAKGMEICSSEAQLNDKIARIHYRIQHETIPLKEEKQLLHEIKLLESTRSDVCANSAANAEFMRTMAPGEMIHDRAEFLRKDMDSLKKDHKQACLEYAAIEKEMSKVNRTIDDLYQQLQQANGLQQDAYRTKQELKKKENSKNDAFYRNRRNIQAARELAAQKNLEELEEFCMKQVVDFMGMWNDDANFQSEYIKSNERSTLRRLETLDGRSLGPGEKAPQISETDMVPTKCEDVKPVAPEPMATNGLAKVSKAPSLQNVMFYGVLDKESLHGNGMPVHRTEGHGSHFASTTANLNLDAKENIVDHEAHDAEHKEKHRQEQITKAKEAEERKRRRAEKLEVKAQARAKKDAERIEREREKRAQKKAAASTSLSAPAEVATSIESLAVVSESTPALPVEDISQNGINIKATSKSQRGSGVSKRKPSGLDLKGPRPFPHKVSILKRSAWPIPRWACASIAAVPVFASILFLRWQGTF